MNRWISCLGRLQDAERGSVGCYQLYQRWNSGPGGLPGSLQCARASAQSADNQGQQDCSSHPGCNIQYFTGIIKG